MFHQYFGIDRYFRPIASDLHLWPNPNLKANVPGQPLSDNGLGFLFTRIGG